MKSDVWSFGIVLFELFSYGKDPYVIFIFPFFFQTKINEFYGKQNEMENEEVAKQLKEGFRLTPPSICPTSIKEVMIKCWEWNSQNRPTFEVKLKLFSFCSN